MDGARLFEKLRKLLALTTSPVEGEAQAAAARLQAILTEHNLSMADLERRGQEPPRVREERHDLGKAAFRWKLRLADEMAGHYYCYPLTDHYRKTVAFVGRPDNVKALQMLYAWVIDQIRRIAAEERRRHAEGTGEHVDPLRWQVHFGEGAAERLGERLREMRRKEQKGDPTTTALVLHHEAEISDFLESRHGFRTDGRETKEDRERRERREREAREKEKLKERDIEEFYRRYPEERPPTPEQQAAQEKAEAEERRREARNARRRRAYDPYRVGRERREPDWRKEEQSATAERAGRKGADRVNLQPFIEGRQPERRALDG